VGLFRRRTVQSVVAAKHPEHTVIVHYSLTGSDHGTEAERERLFAAMKSTLRSFDARPAFAILRFGEASDAAAEERRVEL
jgi:hypothetical protein